VWHDASSRNQRDAKLLLCSYNILVPFLSFVHALCNDNCFVERYAPSSCKLHLCVRRPATYTSDSFRYSLPLKFCEFREFVFSFSFPPSHLHQNFDFSYRERKTQSKITAHAFRFSLSHYYDDIKFSPYIFFTLFFANRYSDICDENNICEVQRSFIKL